MAGLSENPAFFPPNRPDSLDLSPKGTIIGMTMIDLLLIDDEPDLLELSRLFLERSGTIRVDAVLSGGAAIERLASGRYDAVVSDYQMAGMDGIELLKFVRERHPELPFILLTGKGREEVVIEALNFGADFYLQKGGDPYAQFVELEHKVRQAVSRRRAEEEARAWQQRLADIINFLPDATFVIDRDKKVIAWNRAIEEMTGVKAADIMGEGDFVYALPFYGIRRPVLIDLIFESEEEIRKKYYDIVRRTGDLLIAETNMPRPMGRHSVLWGKASLLYDGNGEITGAIESIRDVTDRRVTEEALRESEARYRAVVETQEEFICRFRPDGTHIFANKAYCKYFGKYCREIAGSKFHPEIPGEDRSLVKDHFLSLTPERPGASIQHRVVLPTGEVRWHHWNDRAIFDHDGAIVEYQSVGRDITELKQIESALKESEQRLNAIVDGSPVPQFVIDRYHRVISWNRALEELTGILAGDIIGTDEPWRAFYPKKRPCLADLMVDERPDLISEFEGDNYAPSRFIQGAYEMVGSFPGLAKGGRWLHITAAAIRSREGRVIGAIETFEDITEQKRTEQALQLTNQKLNLMNNITRHDILNQITILLGNIELARELSDNPEVAARLDRADSAADTIREQIEFTREYQNIGVKKPQWQDIGRVIDSAVAKFRLPGATVENRVRDLEIFADPLLEKVFFNLIDNSVKHGGQVGRIRFDARESKRGLVIGCDDDGTGIPGMHKKEIFEPGFGKGSGFGLFLTREILDITGIGISETGTEGKGARFEILVPEGMFRIKGAGHGNR